MKTLCIIVLFLWVTYLQWQMNTNTRYIRHIQEYILGIIQSDDAGTDDGMGHVHLTYPADVYHTLVAEG
jgi:hypothetical protein